MTVQGYILGLPQTIPHDHDGYLADVVGAGENVENTIIDVRSIFLFSTKK